MDEYVAPALGPVPTEPSEQSQQFMRRMRGARAMHERVKPHGLSLRTFRLMTEATARLGRMPSGVTTRSVRYGSTVRGRLSTVRGTEPDGRMLLWLHGGGFISGSPRAQQKFVAQHCLTSGLPTFIPRYRRAPERPFPAAADDVLRAYRTLLAEGFDAADIRLAGESSGGALAVGLLADLKRHELPMPGAVLLLSPLLDLSLEHAKARDAVWPDPWGSPGFAERANQAYVGDTPLSDPRLDLLGADMRGWPPTLVQVGGTECLVDDVERFGAAMRAAGACCEVQLWPRQVHCFALLGDKVPEATAAREYAARFLAAPDTSC